MQDITIKTSEGRFNYRLAGVAIHKGRVLLLKEERFDFWYLPGGRATLFETSEDAIRREIFEELGERPVVERLLWTTECLYHFEAWNTKHHDLTFYYLISFAKDSLLYSKDAGEGKEEFSAGGSKLFFEWVNLEKLEKIPIVPKFLKQGLKSIPEASTHLILDELSGT